MDRQKSFKSEQSPRRSLPRTAAASMILKSPRMKNIIDASAKRSKDERIKTIKKRCLIDEHTHTKLQNEFSKSK